MVLPVFAALLKEHFELQVMGSGNISYTFGHSHMGTDRYDPPWGGS
jgi:hypothetical protein